MDRSAAVDRVLEVLETLETEPMPVPITELWVFGDLALGLDPIERLELYVAKDLLFARGDTDPDGSEDYKERYGVAGIGTTVDATWAREHPEAIRTNPNGHVAPEKCLAAYLTDSDEPIHLEVCNAGFERNVTQRLEGAAATEEWSRVLDPRGVCLWKDGARSETAPDKLRAGEYVFPTLKESLSMLGLPDEQARTVAQELERLRANRSGSTVRGDVI